jgi:hypothetical protein
MLDNVMQAQTRPFIKLAQSNMELLTRFSTSPEVMSQAAANASQMFQMTTESAMRLMQTGAFAQMMQGMFQNYTEFLTELAQSGMAVMTEGSAAMSRHVEDATSSVVDATEARGRRNRQAA